MPAPRAGSPFARRVLLVTQRIPPGRVATYGDVARLAGRPGAARAVGTIMRTARIPGLPYFRVVAAGGRIGGYGGAPQLKASLLGAEGVLVRGSRIVDFTRVRWTGVSGKASTHAADGARRQGRRRDGRGARHRARDRRPVR